MNSRPITTLFLIQSLDGKISTGDNDNLDVDKDFKRIVGVKEGLYQYYDLEQQTDLVSFNSGRVQEKIGINEKEWKDKGTPISFIVVDNKPHLNEKGVEYFAKRSKAFYLITTDKNHPAYELKKIHSNIHILFYENEIDFADIFSKLKEEFEIDRITVQTGGSLNAELVRAGLIDYVSIVVAPCLIGGKNTQSLIGGESLHSEENLKKVKALKLLSCDVLKNSYLHLKYEVIKDTKVEN
jgi:2,5-diamino-6-(ribosylamino)-4(3H)-pyrimidinone 5'-phosphate reductase